MTVKPAARKRVGRRPGKGGDVSFHAGVGSVNPNGPPMHGTIRFFLGDGSEIISLNVDGECFVNGHKVADDIELYQGLRAWYDSMIVEVGS